MFDLDMIEMDWMNNSFKLSEEEIIEIYRLENVTLSDYYNQIDGHKKNAGVRISAEERILRSIFGGSKEIIEIENELKDKHKFSIKKHLSENSQKKVVEGSLHIVFSSTRQWYKIFGEQISMEIIYYLCLEALMNSVKYMIHCEKPVFELYVLKSITRNIIKYISKLEHITYKDAYKIVNIYVDSYYLKHSDKKLELLGLECNEKIEKPAKIYYLLKNESYDADYIRNVSSIEFMKDYYYSLDSLDETSKMVMQMSFDTEGNKGLTNIEIAERLRISPKSVSDVRKKAIKTLQKDMKLRTYCRY